MSKEEEDRYEELRRIQRQVLRYSPSRQPTKEIRCDKSKSDKLAGEIAKVLERYHKG